MKNFLYTLWQLPQIIVGMICGMYAAPFTREIEYNGVRVIFSFRLQRGCICGRTVILSHRYYEYRNEYPQFYRSILETYCGMAKLSLITGWFSLPLVWLPVEIHRALYINTFLPIGAYSYWERIARKLGSETSNQ